VERIKTEFKSEFGQLQAQLIKEGIDPKEWTGDKDFSF
jgi:hypothetical protein